MLLRTRLFGIAVRFTVVDGSVSDVDAVGCEMASGGVTLNLWLGRFLAMLRGSDARHRQVSCTALERAP